MTTALLFIAILAVLVFVHELGHFLAAKLSGARVDRFAIGFPPRIWGKKVGETDYAINLVPFGGYVSIHGEQYDEDTDDPDAARSLAHKNRALQVLVFAAGIIMNLLFAWGLFAAGFMVGLPTSAEGSPYADRIVDAKLLITGVRPDSPAQRAGLSAGDEILYVGSGAAGIADPSAAAEVSSFIAARAGEPIEFLVRRADESVRIEAVAEEGIVAPDAALGETSRGAVGISLDRVGMLSLPFIPAIVEGARATYVTARTIVVELTGFFADIFAGTADLSGVSGPVGIASIVGEVRGLGLAYLVTFTAFISINLAVLNLLPVPALDGGRILFVLVETVLRRRLPARFAQAVNLAGFALLILLMLVITYRDIVRLVVG